MTARERGSNHGPRSLGSVDETLLKKFQNFRRMGARVRDRNPVLFDYAVWTNQCSRANRPFRDFTLGVLARSPSAIGFHGFLLLVGQEHKRKVKLADELIMRIDAIRADTHHHGIRFSYGFDSVAEPARFPGSTRGIVLGVKPQNHIFPGVLGQRMLLAVAPR